MDPKQQTSTKECLMDVRELPAGSRIAPVTLGHRGSRMAVDVSRLLRWATDERSDLPFCSIKGVFTPGAVFLGFGIPNVFLMVPREDRDGWEKFTAFMFWRQASYVAERVDRMQVGVYLELRDLPNQALVALRREMELQKGRRTVSCANANARVLSAAGFTSGGKSLERIVRPSHLIAFIWQNGLEYNGKPVGIRPIQAGSEVGDHFRRVWFKEFTSPARTLKKKYIHHDTSGLSAPRFEEPEHGSMPVERWEMSEGCVQVGISRPSWLGVWLGFVLGQRPIFTLHLEQPLPPELDEPLKPFPGELDRVTKIKKYILFSRPVVRFIRHHLMRSEDVYTVPLRAVAEMLRLSPGLSREGAFVYNLVVTTKAIHMSRLENRNGRDRKIINWIMAKHLVVGGYEADVVFAGENWAYVDGSESVVCVSPNSGTYKPESERADAVASGLSQLLDARVEAVEL